MGGLCQYLDTKALLSDISANVSSIFTTICGLKSILGINNNALFPDVWSGIHKLSATASTKSLCDLTNTINSIIENDTIMESHITINKAQWNSLFTNWLPVLVPRGRKSFLEKREDRISQKTRKAQACLH
jgi:hypothetical protein